MENEKYQSGQPARLVTVLVDDEIGAINTLRGMLGEYCPQIFVAASAMSVKTAVEAAVAIEPDLLFLDIEMPPLGKGFDVLEQCAPYNFGVIFTTAHPKYAIDAITLAQPWAYLVKPFSVSELRAAVQVAENRLRSRDMSLLDHARRQPLIVQDSRKGTLVLRAGNIVYCQAGGSFTDIYVWKNGTMEKITTSRNLGEYEAELPGLLFCRTHNSFLVNMTLVERFERTGRNGVVHFSVPGSQAGVSVAKMEVVAKHFEELTRFNRKTF
ncbi:MAG: response regulator transcription factor [Lewinellaceae bacterium]|nr:response regulator transcription factor [Lewinellaceae bacterium]